MKIQSSVQPQNLYLRTTQNDSYELNDGFDSSRDIVAISSREGKPEDPFRIRLEMRDLQEGAAEGQVDAYVLMKLEGNQNGNHTLPDTVPGTSAGGWNLALAAYDEKHYALYGGDGQRMAKDLIQEVKFDAAADTIEMALDKEALRAMGWNDSEGILLQPFTAKDMQPRLLDSLDRPADKPWTQSGDLGRSLNTVPGLNGRQMEDWAGDSVYFVLTDRFEDGDLANNIGVDKSHLGKYHGGDLQGIINKLDYIQDLGMKSVWITPVMENQEFFVEPNNTGYHGYWPTDLTRVDERLGDMEKFQELVDKAHAKGLKVLLDLPLNHVAWEHPFRNDPDKADWFHNYGDVKNWDDPVEAERGSIFGLPDLAQENPEVYDYLVDISKFWMRTGIDGFRLDAVKNINFDFWPDYNREIHEFARDELGKNDFFLIGECFDARPDKVNSYQKTDMDSLFDYPLKFTAHEVLAHDGSMRKLAAVVEEGNRIYQSPELMSGFLDNHDTERFLSASAGDHRKLNLAMDFLFTINRVPSLYYGTETGMDATPPEGQEEIGWPATSRKDMEFDGAPQVKAHLQDLARIRNGSPALSKGSLKEMWVDDLLYGFSRLHPEEEAVVFLNNGEGHEQRQVPLRPENRLIQEGTVLVDALSGEEVTVQDGKIPVEMGPKSARIFFPKG